MGMQRGILLDLEPVGSTLGLAPLDCVHRCPKPPCQGEEGITGTDRIGNKGPRRTGLGTPGTLNGLANHAICRIRPEIGPWIDPLLLPNRRAKGEEGVTGTDRIGEGSRRARGWYRIAGDTDNLSDL